MSHDSIVSWTESTGCARFPISKATLRPWSLGLRGHHLLGPRDPLDHGDPQQLSLLGRNLSGEMCGQCPLQKHPFLCGKCWF